CATASPARRSLGSFLRLDELSATRSVSGDLAGPKYWRTLAGAGHQATLECCGCRSDPAGRAVPASVVGADVAKLGHLAVAVQERVPGVFHARLDVRDTAGRRHRLGQIRHTVTWPLR